MLRSRFIQILKGLVSLFPRYTQFSLKVIRPNSPIVVKRPTNVLDIMIIIVTIIIFTYIFFMLVCLFVCLLFVCLCVSNEPPIISGVYKYSFCVIYKQLDKF